MRVILEVTNLAGCYDSIVRYVEIEPVYRIYAPTAFSPNVDGFNDGFRLLTSKGLDNACCCWVYDRWRAIWSFRPGMMKKNGMAN